MEEAVQQVQVVIVGAGPTGLAAANLLGRYGIETLILEQHAGLSTQPRAVAIDDEGLRICQAMGLHDPLLSHVRLNLSAEYRSGRKLLAHVNPQKQPNGYPFISTFHQPTFEQILLQGLARFPCVQICFEHRLLQFTQDSECVTLEVQSAIGNTRRVSCRYLLACDGGKSTIRQVLQIPLRPVSLLPGLPQFRGRAKIKGERWVVIDCLENEEAAETASNQNAGPGSSADLSARGLTNVGDGHADKSALLPRGNYISNTAIIFFCNPRRPAVTVPTPERTRRWEFLLHAGEQEEEMLRPERLQALIQETIQTSGIQQTYTSSLHITRQAIYTFHALLAERFSQGRIFLLGDAAHLLPPFGGQGMTSGLRDAHNLCWKLAHVLTECASPELLLSYEQERAPHAASMIRFSSWLGRMIMPTSPVLALGRDLFFLGLQHLPFVNRALNEMAVKPAAYYPKGYTKRQARNGEGKLVGHLLPQPTVCTEEGKQIRLDELLGTDNASITCELAGAELKLLIEQGQQATSETTSPPIIATAKPQEMGKFTALAHNKRLHIRPDRYIFMQESARLGSDGTQIEIDGTNV